MDVAAWLRDLGLERYAEAFRENNIDAEVLPELTAEDLIALGVTSVGHRRKLLAAIAALRQVAPSATNPSLINGGSAIAAEPAPPATLPEGERRQVTVLFADLSGYTRLSTELDAEELHALMARFFATIDDLVAAYGGRVDKHIGDCVMAVFGAPVAHGNDPERAVRAALDIHAAMPGLSDAAGRALRVHIGIASGQVVASGAGQEAYTVTGESVNLASRLTDAAAGGETLISDAVHRAVAHLIRAQSLGEIAAKGFAAPVRVWRLCGLQSDASAATHHPFVGRHAELQQFRGALAACREGGIGFTVHVRGEAGIGKTRLVEEFQREAEAAGFARHTGLVLDFGAGTGQDAIRALVRGLLAAPAGDDRAARAAVERALAEGLVDAERRVYLNDLLDLPQPVELRTLYDAMDNAARNRGKRETVAALVRDLSALRPLLLVVEDVHWADRITLAHLASLAVTVAACPAVLVMTSRIEGDPLDRAWRAMAHGSPLITLDLAPLRRDEALALAGAFLDATNRFALACVERAEGNPLFLEQLLRHAEESAEVGVPGSIQSLVLARMDRLAPDDKRALQAASVLGQRFGLDALRHLIDDPGYDGAGLVRHYLARPEGEGEFLFAHALIREGVYGSLLKSRRCELHRRAAAWFAGWDPALRAEHLERAEDSDAPRAYAEAAEAEGATFHDERALGLAERGLVLARTTEDRLSLTMLRAELLREVGRPKDSITAFREALDLATDEMIRCRAWAGVAAGVRLLGGYGEGMAALDEAEPLARRHHGYRELARICYYRGCLLFAAGDVDGCLEQHEQAHDAAVRAGDPEWEAWALSGLGDAEYGRGRMRVAMERFRRCRALCRQHGFGRAEVGSAQMLGVTRRYLNECTEAIDDLRAAARTASKVGNARTELLALNILGETLVDHGDLEGAYAAFDGALAIADTLGNRRFRAYILYERGRALWHEPRRRDEAEPMLAEALGLIRETEIAFLGPRVLAARALVTARESVRREALAEGEAIVRSGCLAHNVLWFHRDAIEASLNAGDWDGAERHAAALEAYTRLEPLPWTDFFIARGRALAAWGRGRRGAATVAELERLRGEAERVGLMAALPALKRALAAPDG